jgi:preprotein translocase subunit SecE
MAENAVASPMDKVKFAFAVALVIAGVVGYYWLAEYPAIVRVASVLAGLALGGLVAWFTESGRTFYAFSREAAEEARKVVWPTRKETVQTTLVVFALVVVLGIFMWVTDWVLFAAIQRILGRSD